MKLFLTVILVSFAYFGSSTAFEVHIDLLDPVKALTVDLDFLKSVKTWYFPLWNSFVASRVAQLALEKTKFTNEELTSSCVTLTSDYRLTAYGKSVDIEITKADPTGISFFIPAKGLGGRFNFHKSDIKSYIAGVTTWDDGKVSWGVMSAATTLEPAAEAEARAYISSLQYPDQQVLVNDYSRCF